MPLLQSLQTKCYHYQSISDSNIFPFMKQNKKSKLQILVCEQGNVLRMKWTNQNLPITLTCTIRRDVALQI